ncbi:MAG: methionyl-tRNA formyltransferase [Candidatus Paceibacterota bacterium]
MKLKKENSKLETIPKIAFFGTPELVVPILDELKMNGFIPLLVVTAPDKPQGRGLALTPPPAKIWGEKNDVLVLQPERLDSEFCRRLSAMSFDLFIVIAYGKILTQEMIDIPKFGTFNIHYSILPKYRGATPVESAILNGDKETGVSMQKMVLELDAGPLVALEKTTVGENETSPELLVRLNDIGRKLLIETIPGIMNGTATYHEQDRAETTLTKKITKENGLIDINEPPIKNYRKYLAYFGWPGTYFFTKRKNGDFTRVTIKNAAFENNDFVIKRVLPEGKKEMDYRDFLRGL